MKLKVIASTDKKYIGRIFEAAEVSIAEAYRVSGGLFSFEKFVMIDDTTVKFYNSNYIVTMEIL